MMHKVSSYILAEKKMDLDELERKARTSLKVFRSFIQIEPNGEINASRILSKECYDTWLETRKMLPPKPEKAFQRTLSAHITGVDGRTPFSPDEEQAILKQIRRKQRWPCFANTKVKFGESGFRARGFHEKKMLALSSSSSPKTLESNEDDEEENESVQEEDTEQEMENTKKFLRIDINHSHMLSNDRQVYDQGVADSYLFQQQPPFLQLHDNGRGLTPSNSFHLENGYFNEQNDRIATRFSNLLNSFKSKNALAISAESVSSLFNIMRMLLYSFGWTETPTEIQTEILFERLRTAYTNQLVLLVDLRSRDMKDRYVKQNDVSIPIIGMISKEYGGTKDLLLHPSDFFRVLQEISLACDATNVEFHSSCLVQGLKGPVRLNFSYFLDEETKLLALHGVVSPN